MQRKILTGALLAAGALMALTAHSVSGTVYAPHTTVQFAPPAPIAEVAPAPRPGQSWVAGHYEWRNGQYAWAPGHWIPARTGQAWEEARWIRDNNGQYYMVAGRWVNPGDHHTANPGGDRRASHRYGPNGDVDGDGIRNRDDNDRDGDGVVNWSDDYPNNPQRSRGVR
jgi:hypothetical protein